MELVGGRWTLLIVRDLLGGPKRFSELREGLPGIPTNVLSARLRELEDTGIIHRSVLPRPATGLAYELTEYGADLEQALVTLGVWGARSLGPLGEGDFFPLDALALGLRGMFRPEEATGLDCTYELRVDDDALRVSVHDGVVSFDTHADEATDIVIDTDPDALHALLMGTLDLDDATTAQRARVEGPRTKARQFFRMFRFPAPPSISEEKS